MLDRASRATRGGQQQHDPAQGRGVALPLHEDHDPQGGQDQQQPLEEGDLAQGLVRLPVLLGQEGHQGQVEAEFRHQQEDAAQPQGQHEFAVGGGAEPGQVDEKDGLQGVPDPAGAEQVGEFLEDAVVAGLVRTGGGHQVRNRDTGWYNIMMGFRPSRCTLIYTR